MMAGGVDLSSGLSVEQLSEKGKKRYAMAGCKDDAFRAKAGYTSEARCNERVMSGDVQFMLEAMAE